MTDTTWTMTIDGEAVRSDASFGVVNPASGEVFEYAPECALGQLEDAFQAASRAAGTWRRDEEARREVLDVAASVLTAAVEDLAPTLTAEQGKPLDDARSEVQIAAAMFRYYAGLELPRDVIHDDDQCVVEVLRRPLGVVVAITPWNFPVGLAMAKVAPALLAGNTVLVKPSPYTPLTTLRIGELLREVFPPGVLNVVSGGDELGARMTSHPVPRKVSFTGSVETGKRVAASAADDLKRITLELGGNDPAIVLEDVDVEAVADGLFWGAFANNGQICAAIKRVYVPDSRHDELVDALAQRAREVKVGDGSLEGTQLGPINNRPQLERVTELADDAIAAGARVVIGGHALDGPGYFFAPTILTEITEGTRVVDEEQFGPVLPVLRYRDIDEVVARANATTFGLCGSVWGNDLDRASEVAEQLECGTAWVNTHLSLVPDQPFGGAKWSGIGVENGPRGLEGFSDVQVLHRPKA